MGEVVKNETGELQLDYDSDHVLAGIKRFEKYGINNTIDALAGGDMLKWEEVLLMPYGVVFMKLRMNKEKVLFQRNLRKVLENKQKK